MDRASRKQDKRARIRAAAWHLFTHQGFDKTTTKEVAERAGVATGTLFLYAPDKTDLLFMVIHDELERVIDESTASLPRRDLVAQLMHIFSALFAMYARHPELAKAFLRATPLRKGPNGQRVDSLTFGFFQRLGRLVQEAKERGEVRADVETILTAQCAFALYYFSLTTWLTGYVSLELALEPGLRSALGLLYRGLK
jgi:AcrR family transcriptional regulator